MLDVIAAMSYALPLRISMSLIRLRFVSRPVFSVVAVLAVLAASSGVVAPDESAIGP